MRQTTSTENQSVAANAADTASAAGALSDERGSAAATKTNDTAGAEHSLNRLLSAERTRARVTAGSRKRALEHGCEILAGSHDLNARAVLDALLARERLGSTALGDGVAIPHCRLPDCNAPIGVLLTLDAPVDYNAPDDGDVDLLFILVVPESATDEHLQILSQLAGLLIEPDNRAALRNAKDHLTLYETAMQLGQANTA